MKTLEGKVALITGGSSGIGLATAKLFIQEGAFVFITGRREAELASAVASLGANAEAFRGDIAKLADLDRLFARVQDSKGRIDIVFANAGIVELAPLGLITEDQFDRVFSVNVRGTLFTVQKALALMPDGSSIVLNASVAAQKGTPAFSVYAASKSAVRSFARGWAMDLKQRKIRVNVVSPGIIPTPAYRMLGMTEEQLGGFLAAQASALPSGRVGEVNEIANAVLFLSSEQSSYVNGFELFVDGGMAQI